MSSITSNATDSRQSSGNLLTIQWSTQPAAFAWLKEIALAIITELPWASELAERLYRVSGNRFYDLIDTVFFAEGDPRLDTALAAGWEPSSHTAECQVFDQPKGIFPSICVVKGAGRFGVELKVESVADFLAANDLSRNIDGRPFAQYRRATVTSGSTATLTVAERHGTRAYTTVGGPNADDVVAASELLRTRPRDFDDSAAGFAEIEQRIDSAINLIGRDYTCDLFFAAEREYWTRRNRAAQAQKARQDRLGIGWANHDHHTYRCSREYFSSLVRVFEKLGLFCRERFYAGMSAGWGAQVMEHPVTRVITFNDVDLSAEELMGDFSHDGLAPRDTLATIGLWCGLHGESILQAGMHHLECVFDFDALREQLEREHGIRTMKPFTDFAYLRQAFTEGERWQVADARIDHLLGRGMITAEQGEKFRTEGAIGSHMENLERNDGFKGFNQQGVSEIIAATDPRRQTQQDAFESVKYETVGSH